MCWPWPRFAKVDGVAEGLLCAVAVSGGDPPAPAGMGAYVSRCVGNQHPRSKGVQVLFGDTAPLDYAGYATVAPAAAPSHQMSLQVYLCRDLDPSLAYRYMQL